MSTSNPDPANPLEHLLGYRLRRASSALMGLLGADLALLELRPSEASILVLIAENARITQSEIGRMLGIQRANMAPLIASLGRRGLVGRERVDGRSQGLRLTSLGEERATAARAAMQRHEALLEECIPAEARAGLGEALSRLAASGSRLTTPEASDPEP